MKNESPSTGKTKELSDNTLDTYSKRRPYRRLTTFSDYLEAQRKNHQLYFLLFSVNSHGLEKRVLNKQSTLNLNSATRLSPSMKPTKPKKRKDIITKGTISFFPTGLCFLKLHGEKNTGSNLFVVTPKVKKPLDNLQKNSSNEKPSTERKVIAKKKKYDLVVNLDKAELVILKKQIRAPAKPKATGNHNNNNAAKKKYKSNIGKYESKLT